MAQSQALAGRTIAAVEKAREELNSFKTHINQRGLSDSLEPHSKAREVETRIHRAENLVAKAETTVRRIRNGARVPPRPTASVPPSVRAKKALSVLRTAFDSPIRKPDRSKRTRSDSSPRFLTTTGKIGATPIRDDLVALLVRRASVETGLQVQLISKNASNGRLTVYFFCQHIFIAAVSLDEVKSSFLRERGISSSKNSLSTIPSGSTTTGLTTRGILGGAGAGGSKPVTYIMPEHVDVFGATERQPPRWACSEHVVFNLLRERANAAMRYFIAREDTGEEALLSFAHWLARHKNLFSATADNRRLAFDASRGIFLPPCVRSFNGDESARFTRGTIPLRNSTQTQMRPASHHPSSNANGNVASTSSGLQQQQPPQKQQPQLQQSHPQPQQSQPPPPPPPPPPPQAPQPPPQLQPQPSGSSGISAAQQIGLPQQQQHQQPVMNSQSQGSGAMNSMPASASIGSNTSLPPGIPQTQQTSTPQAMAAAQLAASQGHPGNALLPPGLQQQTHGGGVMTSAQMQIQTGLQARAQQHSQRQMAVQAQAHQSQVPMQGQGQVHPQQMNNQQQMAGFNPNQLQMGGAGQSQGIPPGAAMDQSAAAANYYQLSYPNFKP